jgi:gluconokinase
MPTRYMGVAGMGVGGGDPDRTRRSSQDGYADQVVVILMGVAGSGKTTIGVAFAKATGWRFIDADDFHSAAAVAKMRAGVPLTDEDRATWLAALHDRVARVLDRRGIVLACSAPAALPANVAGICKARLVYLTAACATRPADSPTARHFADRPCWPALVDPSAG